jgi:hypothetical protein
VSGSCRSGKKEPGGQDEPKRDERASVGLLDKGDNAVGERLDLGRVGRLVLNLGSDHDLQRRRCRVSDVKTTRRSSRRRRRLARD